MTKTTKTTKTTAKTPAPTPAPAPAPETVERKRTVYLGWLARNASDAIEEVRRKRTLRVRLTDVGREAGRELNALLKGSLDCGNYGGVYPVVREYYKANRSRFAETGNGGFNYANAIAALVAFRLETLGFDEFSEADIGLGAAFGGFVPPTSKARLDLRDTAAIVAGYVRSGVARKVFRLA